MSYNLKVVKPDGVSSSTTTSYSTTEEEIKIYGSVEGYTEINISYLDETFTSSGNENDIDLVNGSWVFPNTTDGIDVNQGSNTFIVSATDGTRSTELTLIIIVSKSSGLEAPSPPINIKTSRSLDNVEISWVHSDNQISYYNVYGSITSGGTNGYALINLLPIDPVSYGKRVEKVSSITDFEVDIEAIDEDPNILTIQAKQNDSLSVVGTQEIDEDVKRLRLSTNVSSIELKTTITFSHNRGNPDPLTTNNISDFSSLDVRQPLYYVVTAVKVVDGFQVESTFSVEVSGLPVNIQLVNTTLPNVTDAQITEDLISTIYDSDPTASVQAGSAIRDLFIDPVVSEMSRIRVILDFCYKATNFITLNDIDDPIGAGTSLPVESSSFKQLLQEALFLDTSTQTQNLIDLCFDRLASNLGISRRAGNFARGEATFFTSTRPTFDLVIPTSTVLSSGGTRYIVLQPGTIGVDTAPNFYNPITRRYEITLPIRAIDVGISGNVATGQITSGAPLGLRVSNQAPTFGGSSRETNQDLTARSMTYISSVDVGTKAGYERVARESAGVSGYEVIDADSPYMIRDNDLGGKVDIWVRGEILSEVTDVYAPSFQEKRGSRFVPVNSEGSYKFQATDATVEKPLFKMIDQTGVFGLKNQTTGEFFDLTGSNVSEGKILILDTSISQPTYRMTDIILGDYRTDVTDKIILKRQPVRSITSVRKPDNTDLLYKFYKIEDPLVLGQSSMAQDYIIIENNDSEKIISITDEAHTLNELYSETLLNKGVSITTIVVKDSNGNVFKSPLSNVDSDYSIEINEDDLVLIKRTTSSSIKSGQAVLVSYQYLENITVSYQTNLVVSNLQLEINEQKHMGADVLIKEVSPVNVSIKGLIYLDQGVNSSVIDSAIRSSLENLILTESLGGAIYPSDVIREIDSISGVSYLSVPLTQLSLTNGDQILREKITSTLPVELTELTSASHKVWLIDNKIKHKPASSGGSNVRVFLNKIEIETLNSQERKLAANWTGTKGSVVGSEKAFIISNGVSVEIANAENKLMLSLPLGEAPSDYEIEINYTCGDNTGVVNEIKINRFSYFQVGELSFTYEETR